MKPKIKGINARLPSAMTLEERNAEEIMVVSHPGWIRASMKCKDSKSLHRNFLRFKELFEKEFLPIIPKREGYADDFSKLQLFFSYLFASDRFNYIWEDLMAVDAIEYARERKMPIIATIPCTKTDNGYTTTNQFYFRDWINFWLDKNPSSFVLPTEGTFGFINGSNCANVIEARKYHETPEGRNLFGEVLDKTDREVTFAGGHLGSCLAQTFHYFSSQKHAEFLDDRIVDRVAGQDVTYDFSPEQVKLLLSHINRLYVQATEPTARQDIITMLKKPVVKEARLEKYTQLFGN